MITATQARSNAEATKKNLIQQVKEKARLFCEKQISPAIMAASKGGESHIYIDINEHIDINEVKINLIENQFRVSPGIKRNSITIMW